MRPRRAAAALVLACGACAQHHALVPIEEEPFVLSDGPPISVRDELARREALATAGDAPMAAPSGPFTASGATTRLESAGAGRHIRLVHATVAGQPTLMLVDTGAYDHLLEGWFAEQLQDAAKSGKQGTLVDAANRPVRVEQWGQVTLAVDGWSPLAPIRPLTTGDMNRTPRALGIGGILSPQHLAGSGLVAVDLTAGEIASVDEAGATRRLTSHASSLGVASPCGNVYLLDTTIEGHAARLLVDTGATSTGLRSGSQAGRALGGRSSVSRDVYAIGGAVTTRAITDAAVKAGQYSTKVDVALLRDEGRGNRCGIDGQLGMDVLERCVLVIDPTRMRVACD